MSAFGGGAWFAFCAVRISDVQFVGNEARQSEQGSGTYVYGGAMSMIQATATILKTMFRANSVRGARSLIIVKGGALHLNGNSDATLDDVVMLQNVAQTDEFAESIGGAVGLNSATDILRVANSRFEGNTAHARRGTAKGGAVSAGAGALHLGAGVSFVSNSASGIASARGGAIAVAGGHLTAQVPSTTSPTESGRISLFGNNASGSEARGGALYVGEAGSATLRHATISHNVASVTNNAGAGGGMYFESGESLLEDCHVHHNIARMDSKAAASDATGGGVAVGETALLKSVRSAFWANDAGGVGVSETNGALAGNRAQASRAAHISCAGDAIVDGCSFVSAPDAERKPELENSALSWLVVKGGGKLRLANSSLTSSAAGEGMISTSGAFAQVSVRGCKFVNGSIRPPESASQLGIVDCSFDPDLDPGVRSLGPGQCEAAVAGEDRLCDPRAQCLSVPGGGVRCACEGKGLTYKSGVPPDGRRCERETTMRTSLQGQSILLELRKPGTYAQPIVFNRAVEGEAGFNINYSVVGRHVSASRALRGTRSQALGGELSVCLFGQRITWSGTRPRPNTPVLLNGDVGEYSDVAQYELVLSIEGCSEEGGTVVVDGDSVEMDITAYSTELSANSTVTLITHISALASCERSGLTIGEWSTEVHHQARELSLPMILVVRDVDGEPVDVSPQQLTARWRSSGSHPSLNLTLPYVRNEQIRHQYQIEIPFNVRSQPGRYELEVLLHDAFTNRSEGGRRAACALPAQYITVVCDEGFAISTSGSACEHIPSIWISLGPALAALLVTLAIVCYVGRLAWQRTERARRCALYR